MRQREIETAMKKYIYVLYKLEKIKMSVETFLETWIGKRYGGSYDGRIMRRSMPNAPQIICKMSSFSLA